MKNRFKLFGTQSLRFCVITLTVLFAFAMVACDNDTTSSDKPTLTGTVTIANNEDDKETYDVGDTLTASVSGSNVSSGFKYQWQSGTTQDVTYTDITDATESTYEIKQGMEGRFIRVVVSHLDYKGTLTSNPIQVYSSEDALYGQVDIPWVIVVGDNITADITNLDDGGTINYQWMKSDDQSEFTNITNATDATFNVTNDLANKYIQVVVSREGKTGTVTSNMVKVRANAPVVTSVTIDQGDVEVSKGGNYSFSATVDGNNLELEDKSVTWDVSGGNSFNTFISFGWLTVGADETASELTVTATSDLDPKKSDEVTVTLTEFTGNTITITGLGSMKGSTGIHILSSLDPENYDASVASGYADITDGSLTVGLIAYNTGGLGVNSPWEDSGEYYIKIEGTYDSYVYTNGAAINMTDIDSNPKYDFQDQSTEIDFSKFAMIPLGAGGYKITINGLSSYNGAMASVILDALFEDSEWGDYTMSVAYGHAVISGGSVTITLSDANDYTGLTGWTDGGECFIKLSIDDGTQGAWDPIPSFVYTNGSSLETLGITTWNDFYENAPKVNFTDTTVSVDFDKFVPGDDIGYSW